MGLSVASPLPPDGWLPRLFTQLLPRMQPFHEMGVSGTPVYAGYVLNPERSSKLVGQERFEEAYPVEAFTGPIPTVREA